MGAGLPFKVASLGWCAVLAQALGRTDSAMDELGTVQRPLYPTTIWSEVNRAEDSTLELERLLQKYYRPLLSHLRFKFRADEAEAADWLQEFVRRKILLGHLLAKASKDRGRFRTFLINVLDNFVVSELRRRNGQVRCPPGGHVSFEELGTDEIIDTSSSESQQFDAEWARALIAQTLTRMEAECRANGAESRWGVFKARLLDPLLDGADRPAYDELVNEFGFDSPAEASNALITARRMFERLLREAVIEYSGEGADPEAELRELKQALNRAR